MFRAAYRHKSLPSTSVYVTVIECEGVCIVSCPYLHRNNGDTERHYHLRYYKTEKCLHPTASNGHCSKNGQHCMFAHGDDDIREPVYDLTLPPVMAMEHTNAKAGVGMDKITGENEQSYHIDPKWNGKCFIVVVFTVHIILVIKIPNIWCICHNNHMCAKF